MSMSMSMSMRKQLGRRIVSQFMEPRGLPGHLVGWEMALRPSNRKRNAWAVSLIRNSSPLLTLVRLGVRTAATRADCRSSFHRRRFGGKEFLPVA
jgi:hypothetical protein